MKIIKPFPFHFLLIAFFQILSLFAINVNEANIFEAVVILFLTVIGVSLIFFIFLLISKDLQRSGIMATFYCFLFFIYGRLFDIIPAIHNSELVIRHRYLIPIFIGVVIVSTLWVFRGERIRKSLSKITYLLNIFGLGLVLITVSLAFVNFDWTSHVNRKNMEYINSSIFADKEVMLNDKKTAVKKPNIYWLVFDSYASPAVLRKYCGWNDNGLVNDLRSRGFVVNENALSNYPFTTLSIAATLNMCYIHEESGFSDAKNKSYYSRKMIQQNKVSAYLKSKGYDVVMPKIWVKENKTKKVKYFRNNIMSFFSSELVTLFIRSSALRIVENELMIGSLRKDILSSISNLVELDVPNRPTFIYSHVLCPHSPYIFRADGSASSLIESSLGKFGSSKGYVEQVRFIGTKIIEIVDSIRNRDPDAVIIVRADHGDGYIIGDHLLNREIPPTDFLEAQYGILNATYLPPGIVIPEQSTPVNLFRYLFNALFDAKLEILPDKEFFTPIREPFVFYEVTDKLSERARRK